MKRKSDSHKGDIIMRGFVDIRNGKMHQKAENHFVNNLIYTLANHFASAPAGPSGSTNGYSPVAAWIYPPFTYSFMVLGSDTSTPTTFTTSALTAPILGSPGTKANSQGGALVALDNGGQITLTSTWNSGTVTGTVGELGLYLSLGPLTPQSFGFSGGVGGTTVLGSRLGYATPTPDFAPFPINTLVPLTVNWIIQFTFS
jgi:hypothetical protein